MWAIKKKDKKTFSTVAVQKLSPQKTVHKTKMVETHYVRNRGRYNAKCTICHASHGKCVYQQCCMHVTLFQTGNIVTVENFISCN